MEEPVEEINIEEYIRRLSSRLSKPLEYTIREEGDNKILTVTLHGSTVLKEIMKKENAGGTIFSYYIPNKNIKLIYEDFM